MNCVRVPPYVWGALILLFLGVSSAPAEVKLRIYLQDGSLQSGNLIAENPDSFVILGKDGRVEIPKKNIMFVNGKTLKQWNDRPDKLFQTEIMPSDVPNPAFVNDKAALPKPPDIKSLPVVPRPAPVAQKPAPVETTPAISQATPPAAASKAEQAAAPAPTPETKRPPVEARPRHKSRRERVATAAAPQAAPVEPASSKDETAEALPPVGGRKPTNRRLVERAAKGALHRQRGLAYLAQGKRGEAMGELLIARLLEPGNGETNLALARIYRQFGLNQSALKVLDHWTLRKSETAASERAAINQDLEQAARRQLYWQIGAGVGAFSWVPFVLFYRRTRRRRAALRAAERAAEKEIAPVVTPAAAEPEPVPGWVVQAEMAFEAEPPAVTAAPPPPPPSRVMPPPPPVVQKPPELPKPSEIKPVELPPPAAPAEPPAPVVVEPPSPVVVPIVPPVEIPVPVAAEPPTVEEPVAVPEPEREPELEPVAASAAAPDPTEILAMARSVENSLVRANAAAAAGRSDEARRYYRTALALNADCATAHLGLGYLAFSEEKWDTSLLHYNKALEIDPGSADAHYGAARVLLEINRVDEAVPELRATLSLDPTYEDARDALTAIGKPA